jgi:8-oxoguanine deaminase
MTCFIRKKSLPKKLLNMRLWLKNPLAILSEGANGGLIIAQGKIIEKVKAGQTPLFDAVFDASKHVVLPGLINTHHHFFQTLTRAHPAAINKELFPWLVALYPRWARLTPEAFRLGVRLALTELLMSGCTTAADHHYLYPQGLEKAVDIEAEEARAIGIRMTISRGSMNLSQKDGGLPPDNVVQDEEHILADCERVLNLFHDTKEGAMTQIALAPCSPFSVTKSLMLKSAELAARFNAPLHTHLAETLDEDAYCLEKYNCRPLDILEETGWLRPKTWLAHGIHFTAQECEKLGKHHIGVCHCPTSNAMLASGFCKVKALEAAGAPVGLGVDGSASNDASNMMEAVRHAVMVSRLHYRSSEAVTHLDALRWATQGSAKCLGREDIGALEVGKQADLALFTLDELRFSGGHDPLATLVNCGAHKADRVMVGGQWRVVDGLPLNVDIFALREAHGKAAMIFAN